MRDELLGCVRRLSSPREKYTDALFKEAARDREKAIAASGTAVDRDELLLDTSLLLDEFEKCKKLEDNTKTASGEEQLKAWRKLLRRCKALNGKDQGQKKRSKLEKQILWFQEALLNFIVAKENKSQDMNKCYTAMTKEFKELKRAGSWFKVLMIANYIGGITTESLCGLDGVACRLNELELKEPEKLPAGYVLRKRLQPDSATGR
ncbi:hypothetical protein PoB_002420900 [Plakobranchus ocellatus]|uniref:Uncharacterized protein n=1 Tax=Plakobranchus ocellatus TaxID=259542 RepID=A0AAV3ZUW7_9GAST|nr:hypothetical protein PoB_002420900 [Plakobranchus ocellatus]